LIRSKIK
jgi:hypothetical protein